MICHLHKLLQFIELLKLSALAIAFSAGRGVGRGEAAAKQLSCLCLCFKTSFRLKNEFVLLEGAGKTHFKRNLLCETSLRNRRKGNAEMAYI